MVSCSMRKSSVLAVCSWLTWRLSSSVCRAERPGHSFTRSAPRRRTTDLPRPESAVKLARDEVGELVEHLLCPLPVRGEGDLVALVGTEGHHGEHTAGVDRVRAGLGDLHGKPAFRGGLAEHGGGTGVQPDLGGDDGTSLGHGRSFLSGCGPFRTW